MRRLLYDVLFFHQLWVDTNCQQFELANLSEADLNRADLSGANLSRADLSDADLSGADLSGANLSRANLSRANLSGADILGFCRMDFGGWSICIGKEETSIGCQTRRNSFWLKAGTKHVKNMDIDAVSWWSAYGTAIKAAIIAVQAQEASKNY